MPSKRLRLTTRFQEILSTLEKSVEGEGCFIWKAGDRKRARFPATVTALTADRTRIVVRQQSIQPGINPGEVVYLKLPVGDAALKVQVVERVGARLTLEFPEQMALHEGRKNPRFYFHPSEEKTAQIRTPLRFQGALPERLHICLVCDISRGGIAIFIPAASKEFFDVQFPIRLLSLGIHRLDVPVKGEVLYRVPAELKGTVVARSGYKIGIKFEKELEQATLDRFLLKRNLFSVSDERLVRDEHFRRKVSHEMGEVKKRLQAHKSLKGLFTLLDRPGPEGHYLKQHIQLLCQVTTGLGTKLGWISERSIDKLIYVSYLHDVRLSDHPKLLRIQGKREFEKLKNQASSQVTDAERVAFFESPAYSAEIARMDLESYPDAIRMLEQQKELPDGSGFPHGLTASRITPLAALFIVSHYLVDYVIDHPDWTAEDFVRSHQGKFKGQYFQKILTAILGES